MLSGCKLFVAAENPALTKSLRDSPDWTVIDLDPEPIPTQERMNLALLKAVTEDQLQPGAHVVALYNGIATLEDAPEPIDSLSVIHLGEHLERMTAQDLRVLGDAVPLDMLRAVVDLATEIGREGREGQPVGTILVVGDTRKVLSMSRFQNFNPFRGYTPGRARRPRPRRPRADQGDRQARRGDPDRPRRHRRGRVPVPERPRPTASRSARGSARGTWPPRGSARQTNAIAFAVSQSSGTVRVFQNGEEVLHIEPLARPHVWQPFKLETQEDEEEESRDRVG